MKNALGHIGMGLLLMAPFVYFGHPWLGWACQSYYWLGREVGHHENREKEKGNDITHGLRALHGFNIFKWNRDGVKDLLAPVVANGAVAAAASYVL